MLTETWLTPEFNNNFLINGYNCMHTHRNRNGGGLRLYYHNSLTVEKIEVLSGIYPTHEALSAELFMKNLGKIIILGVYRPPSKSVTDFNKVMYEAIAPYSGRNIILLGDLNINLSHQISQPFGNMLRSCGLNPMIADIPTHFNIAAGKFDSCIDHIWSNMRLPQYSYVIEELVSDHRPIILRIGSEYRHPLKKICFRNFNDDRMGKFLINAHCEFTNNCEEVTSIRSFNDWSLNLAQKYFPTHQKIITVKRQQKPWINRSILAKIKQKHEMLKRGHDGDIDTESYKSLCRSIKLCIHHEKKKYFNNQLTHSNNPKTFWKLLGELSGFQKNRTVAKSFTTDCGKILSNPALIADEFNHTFLSDISTLFARLSTFSVDLTDCIPNNPHTIYARPSAPNEVADVISSLKTSNSTHDVPTSMMKSAPEYFAVVLSNLFNSMLESGIYPEDLKHACVTPVHKKGSTNIIKNYRPISILTTFDKIFEKLIYRRLMDFFTAYNLLSATQFGFRSNMGTEDACLRLIDLILPGFAAGKYVACVFADFSKAFDTVSRHILLRKLHRYGIRGNMQNIMGSFLSGRSQSVQFDNHTSVPLLVEQGVPQGSCLGPLIYIIYTNDLTNYLDGYCEIVQYADDTVLICTGNSVIEVTHRLNQAVNRFHYWCNHNKLHLNLNKTKVMLLTSKLSTPQIKVNVESTELEQVQSYNYLGLIIDSKLRFERHADTLISKIRSVRAKIGHFKYVLTADAARSFYYAYVYSKYSYVMVVWGGRCDERLISLHDKIVMGLFSHLTHVTEDVFKKYSILPGRDLYAYLVACKIYKVVFRGDLPFIKAHIEDCRRLHDHNTRNASTLRPPMPNKVAVRIGFLYNAVKVWNNIPQRLKQMKFVEFKTELKRALLEN